MKSIAVLALVCAAGSALADITNITNFQNLPGSQAGYTQRDASGIFGARMAVFSAAGGAFYDDSTGGAGPDLQNFGVDQSMGMFQGRDIRISSSMTILPNGNQQIIINAFTADGNPFVAPGTTLGGSTINALQFDIGTPNAPADPIDFNSAITIVSATFTVSSATQSFGPFNSLAASPNGNDLTLRSGVNAGNDITGLGINRFTVTAEVTKIPAPGALALMGLGGLVATRRRR